jgi:hypothetical protein
MMETEISTYADSQDGVDLVPGRTRLLFAAWINHGPGFPEKVEYRVGPSKCGQFDVLRIRGDWEDQNPMSAGAWTLRGHLRGVNLRGVLLEALLPAQSNRESATGLNFDSVSTESRSLLPASEISFLITKVFQQA